MCAVATPESVQAIPSPMSSCSGVSMCAEKPRCPICGDVSHNKHFGIWSCNACSAFFRRTISKSRRYTCVKGKACSISYADARHICRYCRFERCIKLGMNIQSVFVRSTDEYRHFDADSPLRQILLAQRATFVNRYASLLKHYGNDPSRVKMGAECPSLSRTVVIVASEFSVLTEYLLTSGFKDLGLTDLELQALAKCLFYPWMAFHSIMGVLRNAGHKTNVAYFLDESHVRCTDEAIAQYVRMLPNLLDYRTVQIATTHFFKNSLDMATQLHSQRMDEFHIFALRIASRMFPQKKALDEMINTIFSHLTRHFEKNYDSVPVRLGNMILMFSILERATTTLSEYVNVLYLNGYNPVASQLVARQSN